MSHSRRRRGAAPLPGKEPVAIVGAGCRYPGNVRDLDTLGAVLTGGGDVIGDVPADRWGREMCDPGMVRPGTTRSHRGAFLDDIDRFDAEYFGVAPREADSLDPQQRVLLEVAWEAMSDAGMPREDWRGTRTAVYIGMLAADYALLHAKTLGPAGIGPHYASGVEFSFAAGRLAYTFDLHGPAATLNSACSSSLLAVHLAAQSLRLGECDIALAGGVSLLVTPELNVFMSRIGAVSPTGRCRPFDVAADGVVRGEGCGVVVLKRLSDAVADGDRVYATVRGSAINHDGFGLAPTAPNGAAQERLLREALEMSGIGPDGVDYVEAHGTGTPLGDQIELAALAEVYGHARPAGRPLFVGSHKAVFGHTDAAAGIAGLLKTLWILNAGRVPAQPGLETPIPAVDWPNAGLEVPVTTARPAATGRPVRAAVSAMGLSGTNAHVIVEAPPGPLAPEADTPGPHVLLISAPDRERLAEQVAGVRSRLGGAGGRLPDLLASAATRRTHERHRYAVVAGDRAALIDRIDDFGNGSENACDGAYEGTADPDEPSEPVFVYSGQGCQWPGMAADLHDASPTVRDVLDECDALIRRDAGWSLMDELRRTGESRLERTDIAQPAIFAVQVALTRWLTERAVAPSAVVGHSVGEIAAAHTAGCLSLGDAVRLVVLRGRILHETAGSGRMLAVRGAPETVRDALAATGLPVVVATVNGPASVVVAGPAAEVEEAGRALLDRGLPCVPTPIDYAFHSPVVAHCGPLLRAALDGLSPAGPTVRLLSSVEPDADLAVPDAAYWERNLTGPVLLWPAIDRLLARGDHPLVEIGPHPVLARPLADAAGRHGRAGPVVPTLRRGEPGSRVLLESLARLHVTGVAVDWGRETGRPRRYHDLPRPSWRGDRYWLPGVERGRQAGANAPAPAEVRLSLLDADGGLIEEMVARPPAAPGGPPRPPAVSRSSPPGEGPAETGPPVPAGTAPAGPAGRGAAIVERVEEAVRAVLGFAPERPVPRRRGLFELGLDSLTAMELRTRLGTEFGVRPASTVVFEHPTVEALSAHVADLVPRAEAPPAEKTMPASGGALRVPGPDAPPEDDAVAVVGVACRLPHAGSPEAYWRLLREGGDAVGDLPGRRRADPVWAEAGPDVPTRGGYLDDVTGFDAPFFRIAPREARAMDPQQRLLLEVAWEALEDAGLPADRLTGLPAGVYLGLNTADYQQLLTRDMADVDLYYGTGTSFAAAAGRVSYFLGVRGPSVAVDTACSASLTAVHLACQGLRAGDCEVAIVGGANVIVAPTVSVSMAAGGALAPDGRCKTFDDSADGYGRGEGAAVFVLKPFSAALRDGDRVYAVVRGTAVNQDGASGGLTVPSATAQSEVVRRALDRAGWAPGEIDYVETHGTGTPLGDPIEVRALAEALGPGRDEPVLIGSVKANIGHLEAAAGSAALLKVVLALHHGEIPPHRIGRPSRRIDWEDLPVEIATGRRWPDRGRTRKAGVSAFGFTGGNAHVLVEQAPSPPAAVPGTANVLPYVLPVTAATAGSLRAAAARMADRVRTAAPEELADIVYTASRRRAFLDHRAAVTGADAARLTAGLDAVARGEVPASARVGHVPGGEPRAVAFWYGDDLPTAGTPERLADVPAYAGALAACADELAAITGERPDLFAPPPPELRGAFVFAHHVAATRLWAAAGVVPDGAAGLGAGEVGAAWAAGRLGSPDAFRLLTERSPQGGLEPARIPVVSAGGEGEPADATELGRRAAAAAPDAGDRGARRLADAGLDAVVDVVFGSAPAANIAIPGAAPLDGVALAAAELFVTGGAPSWDASAPKGRVVSLPPYPWERRRYWYREPPAGTETGATADDRLFTIDWERVEPPAERIADPGAWALIGGGELADDLASALGRRGHTVLRPDRPATPGRVGDWRTLLDTAGTAHPGRLGVVLIAGDDTPPETDLFDGLALGRVSAALPRPAGRVWFVTGGAHDPAGGAVRPAHTALWELGRVLAMENPGRWGGLIDADADGEAVARALLAAEPDDQVRIRCGGWYAARLARARPAGRRDGPRPDRWHVVIGDAPAAPAVTALAAAGARRLLIAGEAPVEDAPPGLTVRRCAPGELPGRLAGLDGEGVGDIVAVPAPAPTAALADTTGAKMRAHLAGAIALTRTLTEAAPYRPDRITVVTSTGPAWGSVNTAAGAAAAGWLTGWSRTSDVPAGLLALMPRTDTAELSAGHEALFEESGLRMLTPGDAAELIRAALLGETAERYAAAVDLDRYVRLCQDLAPRTFLAGIEPGPRAPTAVRSGLLTLSGAAREEALLDRVTAVVAGALGLDDGELDPEAGFFDLGMDSVMALSVRTRLEDDLGEELASTLTFEYPTSVRLTGHLAGLLAPADAAPPDGTDAADGMDGMDDGRGEARDVDDDPLSALRQAVAAAERHLDRDR